MKSGISRCLSFLTLSLLAAIIAASVLVLSALPTEREETGLDDSVLFARSGDCSFAGAAPHGAATHGAVATDTATQLTPYSAGCPEFADEPTAEGLCLRITRIKHELSLDDLWLEPSLLASSAFQSTNLACRGMVRDIPSYDALLLPSVRLQV